MAIHNAARDGHVDIVRRLVEEEKIAVDVKSNGGSTALYYAAMGGHVNVVRWLVNKGKATVNMKNRDQRTALHWAARYICMYVCACGIVYLNMYVCMYRKGYAEVVKFLVEVAHANVEPKDFQNNTPLHLAASYGHVKAVECLVLKGKANVEVPGDGGITALHYSASEGYVKVVQFLIENGKAAVDGPDHENSTALHISTTCGHLPVVQWLVTEGKAKLEARDMHDRTPLHLAAFGNKPKVVEWLVNEAHSNMEARDDQGKTPLFRGQLHLGVIKSLIEAGADTAVLNGAEYPHRQFIIDFHVSCKLAFFCGFHKRLGHDSSIRMSFGGSTIFEPALVPYILEYSHTQKQIKYAKIYPNESDSWRDDLDVDSIMDTKDSDDKFCSAKIINAEHNR